MKDQLISVQQAADMVMRSAGCFGTEVVSIDQSIGRILAEHISADRDIPPYDRVTMDGIGIVYEAFIGGNKSYAVEGIAAAGSPPTKLYSRNNCIEVMTGAIVPAGVDTVIRIEDTAQDREGNFALTSSAVIKGHNIHYQGSDTKNGSIVIAKGEVIKPTHINLMASVGRSSIAVNKFPKVAIISTGDELVEIDKQPTPYQIRRSNNYMMGARLGQIGIPYQYFHFADLEHEIEEGLGQCIEGFDAIILSGGVSKGKFDFLPNSLTKLNVQCHFHGVKQRPGKPFWFGVYENKCCVFAFPGNPVSSLACLHRYFLPWLSSSHCISYKVFDVEIDNDVVFNPNLTYLALGKLIYREGKVIAIVNHGRGSGDIVSPLTMDGFIEFPEDKESFTKGDKFSFYSL